MNAMRVVSLFSGAGGLDLGLKTAGLQIIWANDNDPDAVATYKLNIGSEIHLSDIEKINDDQIPDCEILVGGFPCQGFSQANLKRHAGDNRNKLYKYFLKTLQNKKPLFFVAENVRGILSLDNGKAVSKIKNDFRRAGYELNVELINCADFGVPQSRWRVFFFGTSKKISKTCSLKMPHQTHAKRIQNGFVKWITIREALKDIPEPSLNNKLPNHIYSKYKVTNRNFTGHRRTDPNKPSPTILARGNGKGGVCAIQHYNNHRRMSVREQATLQTFPKTFKFFGSLNSCYRQVGNAVPVKIGEIIGRQLICEIRKLKI